MMLKTTPHFPSLETPIFYDVFLLKQFLPIAMQFHGLHHQPLRSLRI